MNTVKSLSPITTAASRRGSLLPVIAVAILVIGGCLALVLDRLWLTAARTELRNATESAVLAAAARLADDERLDEAPDASERLTQSSMLAARNAAAGNLVAGQPVGTDPSSGVDVRFGHHVPSDIGGPATFLETNVLPTSVQVQTIKTRRMGNPIARMFGGLVGEEYGDAVA
ncbi:MAG: pilus assembly protein TadG-related protein, partial [Planctomycetaceae bacterium]